MEPTGRNQWQLVANRTAPKMAQTSENDPTNFFRLNQNIQPG